MMNSDILTARTHTVSLNDLKGVTPELLAKALLHNRRRCERVAGDQVPVKQAATDQAANRVPHFAPACLGHGCYVCRQTHGRSGQDAWG